MRIGLIVNPIAGLGGSVGLKGSDGPDTVAEALRRGAVARCGDRARLALARFAQRVPGARITVAPGPLGADWLDGLALNPVVLAISQQTGTARDTRAAVSEMAGHDLIVFAGGDGTARDVAATLPSGAAMLGIPAGVKMHSGVFAVTPEAAGALLAEIATTPQRITWSNDAEVMDIDEAALRAGHIAPRLYGHARVPLARSLMQASKGMQRIDASAALAAAAAEIVETMMSDTLYIIGPGTSAAAVMRAAGHPATLLGIDALRDGKLIARDAQSSELEALAGDKPIRIVLGVTGQQGFLLGRGNQQISAHLISRAGRDGLIILATEAKLIALPRPCLLVDTGDPALNQSLAGFVRVRTGRGRETMMRIAAG